jgi:DNA-directed RNA polymerase specialized sigma24 family protein
MSSEPTAAEWQLLDAVRALAAELLEPLDRRLAEAERQLYDGAPRKWLTLAEAGERLGCSATAVRMRVKRGRLKGRHQGRRLYVSAESVDRLGH